MKIANFLGTILCDNEAIFPPKNPVHLLSMETN